MTIEGFKPLPDSVIEQCAGKIVFNRSTKWWLRLPEEKPLFDREVDKLLRNATGDRRPQALRRQLETHFAFSFEGDANVSA